jgi:5-methylthioadenosine/S-adenosylhomocysteine deaminase
MEINLLLKNKVKVVHCPTSNLKLASGGTMPLVELLNAGVAVLLGTDSPASNNSLDMIQEMKFAALVHKAHRWDPAAINARTVFNMATYGNKDIILIDLKDIRMLPKYDLISNLVYSGGRVTDVIVAGKFVMKDRKILTLNEENILRIFDEKSQGLVSR